MTEHQRALLIRAQESLRGAQVLFDQGLFGFSASRAYYTMFYIAKAFLLGEGLTHSKHSAVIAAFGEHFAKTKRLPEEFHRFLIDGQDLRNKGDYDFAEHVPHEKAEMQLDRARRFLQLAEEHFGPFLAGSNGSG